MAILQALCTLVLLSIVAGFVMGAAHHPAVLVLHPVCSFLSVGSMIGGAALYFYLVI